MEEMIPMRNTVEGNAEKEGKRLEQENIQDNVLQVIEQAAEEMDETDESLPEKWFEWSIDTTTVRTLLKKQKEDKLQLPLCQRLYVWNAEQRARLLESVSMNRPCGVLEIAEVDGVQYLVDGLQRLTSLMYLSMDYDEAGLTKEQKKMVLDYRIPAIVTKDMEANDTKEFFKVFNSGVALASAVKYRSTLSDDLNNAILSLASNEIFRKMPTKAAFKRGHHHELIAENVLLAACGFDVGSNKAKDVCASLSNHEETVLKNLDKAREILNRIIRIYESGIEDEVISRSFTANFLCVLVYVLEKHEFTDEQYRRLINYIFADKTAVKAYTVTTANGAADAAKCRNRFDTIVFLLSNPPAEATKFNKAEFDRWCEQQTVIKDTANQYMLDFHDVQPEERRVLYMAHLNSKAKDWNAAVRKIYMALEKEVG